MEIKGDRKQRQRCVLLYVACNTVYELAIMYMHLPGALSALENRKGWEQNRMYLM